MITPRDLLSTNLGGSTAFITGAASGIGRASAMLLAAAGARVAALELGTRGIRVNAIAPGSTLTGMTSMAFTQPQMEQGLLRHTPMARLGQPEDIAQAVLYLASPLSQWVTGHLLVVDGGQSLRGLPQYLENLTAP